MLIVNRTKNQTTSKVVSITCHKMEISESQIMLLAAVEVGNAIYKAFTTSLKIVSSRLKLEVSSTTSLLPFKLLTNRLSLHIKLTTVSLNLQFIYLILSVQ